MTAEQVYAMLKKRINSNGVSQEKIEKAVESYLERNPISSLDVRIDGESIVQDGVAEIPMMGKEKSGLIQFRSGYGLQLIGNYLLVKGATETEIINRTGSRLAIFADSTLDYAAKAAMCDGKGAAWTAEEQANARERMGTWVTIADITLEEDVSMIEQIDIHGYRKYEIIVTLPSVIKTDCFIQPRICSATGSTTLIAYESAKNAQFLLFEIEEFFLLRRRKSSNVYRL